MDKQVDYLAVLDASPGHYIFYRRTKDAKGLSFDAWNNKTRAWSPSENACGAFIGLDVFADHIEESEVLRIIERFI